jgi:phosphatidylglycerol:prolipoprotein diacylglycerol transferase
VICLLLFAALWTLRFRIRRPGLLFAIFALLNGLERFSIEFIRVNPRYPIGTWNLSQAQIIAIGWMITGLIALSLSLRKHPR